jgi:hypothetical protein
MGVASFPAAAADALLAMRVPAGAAPMEHAGGAIVNFAIGGSAAPAAGASATPVPVARRDLDVALAIDNVAAELQLGGGWN